VKQSGVKFCALGADALVLEAAGYGVHVQPIEPSTQGLASEMLARGLLNGSRVLCPVPHVTGEMISLGRHVLNQPLCHLAQIWETELCLALCVFLFMCMSPSPSTHPVAPCMCVYSCVREY
jgi:hypothetical protein